MAQQAGLEVALAAIRVDDFARRGLRHRVDRQVAAREVLLERHVGREARGKAVVAGAGLPLGAGERVLFTRVRVQEHWEILADGPVAEREQVVRPGADDHEVPLNVWAAEQPIPDCAADEIDVHVRNRSGTTFFPPLPLAGEVGLAG